MPKESSFQSQALVYLNSINGCVAENVSGNSAQSGRADINGCINGRSFRIELKVPDHGNVPSKKQLYDLLRWQKSGALVMVAYTIEDIKLVFRRDGSILPHFLREYSDKMIAFVVSSKNNTTIEVMLEGYE
jgi:hypothetical protein